MRKSKKVIDLAIYSNTTDMNRPMIAHVAPATEVVLVFLFIIGCVNYAKTQKVRERLNSPTFRLKSLPYVSCRILVKCCQLPHVELKVLRTRYVGA